MRNKTVIPRKAELEIQTILRRDMTISSTAVDAILKKHKVRGDAAALQRAYRKRVGQRYLSSLRDAGGVREILAASGKNGMEYVVVDACSDEKKLKSIQYRLHGQIMGLQNSEAKVNRRARFATRFSGWAPRERRVNHKGGGGKSNERK